MKNLILKYILEVYLFSKLFINWVFLIVYLSFNFIWCNSKAHNSRRFEMWLSLTRVCVHILMLIINICICLCCRAKTCSLIKQWCCVCWHWVPLLWTVIKKTVQLGTIAYERTIHLKWFPWIPAFLEDFITQTISACIKLPLQLKVSCFYKNRGTRNSAFREYSGRTSWIFVSLFTFNAILQ